VYEIFLEDNGSRGINQVLGHACARTHYQSAPLPSNLMEKCEAITSRGIKNQSCCSDMRSPKERSVEASSIWVEFEKHK
jgi:hypothetical protein